MTTWPKIAIDTDLAEGMCFGCGRDNPIGLKLSFQWDGKTVRTEFTPNELYQGWPGLLHGGITACILDEAIAYAARFSGLNTVTARMQIEYKYPIPINESLIITSSLDRRTRKLIRCRAAISLTSGEVLVEGVATQYVVDTVNPPDAKTP